MSHNGCSNLIIRLKFFIIIFFFKKNNLVIFCLSYRGNVVYLYHGIESAEVVGPEVVGPEVVGPVVEK